MRSLVLHRAKVRNLVLHAWDQGEESSTAWDQDEESSTACMGPKVRRPVLHGPREEIGAWTRVRRQVLHETKVRRPCSRQRGEGSLFERTHFAHALLILNREKIRPQARSFRWPGNDAIGLYSYGPSTAGCSQWCKLWTLVEVLQLRAMHERHREA